MKLQNLSYKLLFTIFFFAVAGIIFFLKIDGKTQKVSAAWWNSNWNYRRSIAITNSSGVGKTNVLVKVLENYNLSSLVSAGKLQSDLDDLRFTDSNDTVINYWIEDATSTSVDIWAVIPSLPTSGTSIWMYYGNSSATPVSTPLYSYTGTNQFFDDGNSQFRVKFLSSGTLTPSANMNIDAFLVGGGGSGGTGNNWNVELSYPEDNWGGGGGGGGYTKTQKSINIVENTPYNIVIGVGGPEKCTPYTGGGYCHAGGPGTASSAFGVTANGGNGGNGCGGSGGAGGSGGGTGAPAGTYWGGGGPGGSDGNGGQNGVGGPSGAGQGTTTREFGETTGDLYAGGGGGGITGWSSGAGGAGGLGGGGNGGVGDGGHGLPGGPNTGGGGGGARGWQYSWSGQGGTGIVVLRYTSPGTSSINSTEEDFVNLSVPTQCLIEESPNDTNLKIKWLDNTTLEEAYYIEKSTDGGSWTNIYTSGPNATSYTDTNISPNHTYQYRIAAHNNSVITYNWCYTSTLNLGRGNFNFDGVNIDRINID